MKHLLTLTTALALLGCGTPSVTKSVQANNSKFVALGSLGSQLVQYGEEVRGVDIWLPGALMEVRGRVDAWCPTQPARRWVPAGWSRVATQIALQSGDRLRIWDKQCAFDFEYTCTCK